MADLPRGYNSPEEYFADLDRKVKSRRGSFHVSRESYGQTRQSRGTLKGPHAYLTHTALGDSSSYDEAYGPPNTTRKPGRLGYTGSGASTYDEGLQSRLNKRDDAREAEATPEPPKKQKKKKSK